MAALTTQTVAWSGGLANRTFAAVSASDDIEAPTYGGQILLEVKNAGGSPCTVTVTYPGTNAYGAGDTDPTYSVSATTGNTLIPIHPMATNSSGRVTVGFSPTTSVTAAVIKTSFNA